MGLGIVRLAAQVTGTIEGTLTDPSGAGVPGASLQLVETHTASARALETDQTGRYQAVRLLPGAYELTISRPGFREQVRGGIVLAAGSVVRVDLGLQLGEARERIVVTGDAGPVDANPSEWGSSVRQREMENLPVAGRDVFELASHRLGVTQAGTADRGILKGAGLKLSVNGMRPSQNAFVLDGLAINDASQSVAASAAGQHLGIEGIQEVRVITSPFSAEYGRAAGAVFTAVSSSGTNQWHGSVVEYLRHDALDARNFFDDPEEPRPPLRRNQFGGLLSGPVLRNRLFQSVNYEAIRQTLTQTVRPTVPRETARQGTLPVAGGGTRTVAVAAQVRPYLDLYPLPNGRDFGDGTAEYVNQSEERTREDYAAAKLDWLPSPSIRFATRYTFDDSDRGAPDPIRLWRFTTVGRNQFAYNEFQHLVSPRTTYTLRAAFSRTRSGELGEVRAGIPASLSFVPGRPLGSIVVTGLADIGGQSARLRPRALFLNDHQFNGDSLFIRGRHTLRAGAGIDYIRFNQIADQSSMGNYQFSSLADLLQASPLNCDVLAPGSDIARSWRQSRFYAFVQDEYRAASRLVLSLGLRYETSSTPTEVHGRVATLRDPFHDTAVTLGGPIYRNPSTRNFAPRLSLAWDPFGAGKTVVRAGSGLFFDLLSTRDLLVAGVRLPPFYRRVTATRPSFPNLLASVASVSPQLLVDGLAFYLQQPYVAQWQFSVEKQLGSDAVARLGYSGSRGIHLLGNQLNINTTRPTILPDGRFFFPPDTPRINPAWGQIGWRGSRYNSFYHALLASFERRWRGGLAFQGNYAWGKSIDENSSSITSDFDSPDSVPTVFHYRLNRGRSDFNLDHVFNAQLSWQLPGRRPGLAGKVLRNWEVHILAQAASGFAFAPTVGLDRLRLQGARTDLGQRPDLIAAPGARIILGDPSQYFNPLVFGLPEAGIYGNLGRNTLTGPGLFSLDAGLHRTIWKTERHSVRLRLEVFNLPNHPNFKAPSGLSLFDSSLQRLGTAGRITDTATSARQMQIALRWAF